ncbi:MAG: cytochrome c-type biogenesis protein CcmH, partial [Actinobacteria bacterium]|nr:cytochrome c-type biogenesis protein CcmH [Actinomycetota bacterium]
PVSPKPAALPALGLCLVALLAGPALVAGPAWAASPAPTATAPAPTAAAAPAPTAAAAPARPAAPTEAPAAGVPAAPAPRASLTSIESEVMCVTCGVPLDIAESPQADHERAFIRAQIAQGRTASQIERALVAQLGPGVLALPVRRGFNLAVYIVPIALIAALAAGLAVALPRWRRRGSGGDGPERPALTTVDDARLDAELARFDG